MQVAASAPRPERKPIRVGPADKSLRAARTCYDHLARRFGVAIADALIDACHLEFAEDGGALTVSGTAFMAKLGVDLPSPSGSAKAVRLFCRPCLDWSERRPHLAGRLGAALCSHGLERGWVRKRSGSRALDITPDGQRAYREAFRVDVFAS